KGRGPSRLLAVLAASAWWSISPAPRSEPIQADQPQPQAEDVGQRRIGRPGSHLLLPQIEVAARQRVRSGRIGHGGTIGKAADARYIAPQHKRYALHKGADFLLCCALEYEAGPK